MSEEEVRERRKARDRERNKRPSRRRQRIDSDLKRIYGITIETYENMSEEQGHVCKICKCAETVIDKRNGKIRALAVDHCHQSGKVRGLLCTDCNTLLGKAKDNVNVLKSAIDYLSVVPQFTT